MKLFFVFLLSTSILKAQVVVTQTVGTSAFQVVTSREVKATELIAQALKQEVKEADLKLSEDGTGRALFEIAIFRESQSLSAVKIESAELDNLVSTVKSRLQKSSDWKKLDVSEGELRMWVERKAIANEYLKLKGSSLTAIVTDQEIQDYYEKNRVKFGSTPLEDQRSNIRLFLQKESQQQRIKEWLNALKSKYQIRNDLADLGMDLGAEKKSDPKLEDKVDQKTSIKQ